MIKIDIVKRIAQHLNLKDQEALTIADAILDGIKQTICEHGRLEVRDFGVFQIKARKPRTGRNPRNLEEYPIPPRKVVTFKLGKELKDFSLKASGPSKPATAGGSKSAASAPGAMAGDAAPPGGDLD